MEKKIPEASQVDIETLVDLLYEKKWEIEKLKEDVSDKDAELQALKSNLQEIHRSKAWKVIKLFWTAKWFLKGGSRIFLQSSKGVVSRINFQVKVPGSKPRSGKVQILTQTFFDFDGNNMFYGGAERYLIELVHLFRELGYTAEIYQAGNSNWHRPYYDISVHGVNIHGNLENLTDEFLKLVSPDTLVIYSPFSLASRRLGIDTVGISHGVFWDVSAGDSLFEQIRNLYINTKMGRAFSNVSKIISVDTNTINWLRTTKYAISNRSEYLPNFVDMEQFHPAPQTKKEGDPIVVLYPRRLYSARGFWFVSEIIPSILHSHSNVMFHFVGKADPKEEIKVKKLIEQFPDRIKWYYLPPERMHEAYMAADITLIPTVHSEGTSLSCLEALACGNAVIATDVGGLPNLIIDGFNGLLIEPTSESLKRALERLILSPELRLKLAVNGNKVAKEFNIEDWRARWKRILLDSLKDAPVSESQSKFRPVIFPLVPGVDWQGVQQRPHHLAKELASQGFDVYWVNSARITENPFPGLHIVHVKDDIYVKDPIIYMYYPFSYHELEKYENAFVIYDVLDDISIHKDEKDETGSTAYDYHMKFIERADLVLTCSNSLRDRLVALCPDILLIPNGVDVEHFSPKNIIPTAKMRTIKKPIVGYHGAIAEWFDVYLMSQIAKDKPQYEFVLIGPVSPELDIHNLADLPNVHFLGVIPYEEIPRYIINFDVGILPFKIDSITEVLRPLKIFEYLALKKPVVSIPFPELTSYPGVILAKNSEEFKNALDQALKLDLEKDLLLPDFINEASWESLCAPLIQRLKELS
jgi:glycosyltransferase involved in cell wall biosynthesis